MFYFHHGLDFATEGRIGVPILAMQSGKIIKLQSLRYSIGNSITILQKDGFKSRYGHMDKYADKVLNSLPEDLKNKLKLREDFDRTLNREEEIFIEAGEVIGYSGNTGIGPAHLHVELFKDDIYYNPAMYLPAHDFQGEIHVNELELFPLNPESFIEGKNQSHHIQFNKQGQSFLNKTNRPISIKGQIGIYLSGYEASGRTNRIGFQKITTFLNDTEIQSIDFSKIKSTQMSRSCFVFDNYKSTMSGKPFRYYLHNRESDSIDIFSKRDKNAGTIQQIDLKKESTNSFEVLLEGLNGKIAKINLTLQSDLTEYPIVNLPKIYNVTPKSKTTLSSEDKTMEISFGENSVFSDEFFSIEKTALQLNEIGLTQVTPIYAIKPDYREFHQGYDLLFRYGIGKEMNPDKFGLYGITEKGKILRYYQSAYYDPSNNFYKIHLKNTGYFAILQDESKPSIKVFKYANGHIFNSKDFKLYLRAKDTGSGVGEKGITATIDGEPVLLDFDPEAYLWEIFSPEKIKTTGNHTLEATAVDRAGNISDRLKFSYSVN